MEKTLGMIKPDGVAGNHIGEILARVEKAGLKIVNLKLVQLSDDDAKKFYDVHSDKPFFGSLVEYMTSGPIVAFCMEGNDAVSTWRNLMGATNPENADAGTIRADFGKDIETNTVHGSDAAETAQVEIEFFFG